MNKSHKVIWLLTMLEDGFGAMPNASPNMSNPDKGSASNSTPDWVQPNKKSRFQMMKTSSANDQTMHSSSLNTDDLKDKFDSYHNMAKGMTHDGIDVGGPKKTFNFQVHDKNTNTVTNHQISPSGITPSIADTYED